MCSFQTCSAVVHFLGGEILLPVFPDTHTHTRTHSCTHARTHTYTHMLTATLACSHRIQLGVINAQEQRSHTNSISKLVSSSG